MARRIAFIRDTFVHVETFLIESFTRIVLLIQVSKEVPKNGIHHFWKFS